MISHPFKKHKKHKAKQLEKLINQQPSINHSKPRSSPTRHAEPSVERTADNLCAASRYPMKALIAGDIFKPLCLSTYVQYTYLLELPLKRVDLVLEVDVVDHLYMGRLSPQAHLQPLVLLR